MALAEKSEQLQEQLLVASQELACGTHLLCLLLELSVQMEEDESTVLRSVLTTLTHPGSGQVICITKYCSIAISKVCQSFGV